MVHLSDYSLCSVHQWLLDPVDCRLYSLYGVHQWLLGAVDCRVIRAHSCLCRQADHSSLMATIHCDIGSAVFLVASVTWRLSVH